MYIYIYISLGTAVKDNKLLLKKAIKKKENQKIKSSKQWYSEISSTVKNLILQMQEGAPR
jgi:hypothetical protein